MTTDPVRRLRLGDVPLSFLNPTERKKRRPKVDQLALIDEPDHDAELETRQAFDRQRGPAVRDAFRREVARRRKERDAWWANWWGLT
jgi:hypothetical protein